MVEKKEEPKPKEGEMALPAALRKCVICGAPALWLLGKLEAWLGGYCTFHFFEKAVGMVQIMAHSNAWNFEGYEAGAEG